MWDLLPDDQLRTAIQIAEVFADGNANTTALAHTFRQASPLNHSGYFPRISRAVATAVSMAVVTCHESAYNAALCMTGYLPSPFGETSAQGEQMLCDLLRCVFGNPILKPTFNKKWRTETVTALGKGIYKDHAFDRLPILADALEEAGCDDPAMLSHLRGPGPHCRGCWVLDLALGK